MNIIFNDLPIDDPLQRKPDIKKAVNELKWKAKIELDEGIEKTIKYFKELFNCYNDYKKQWPFIDESIQILDIPSFNIQKYLFFF